MASNVKDIKDSEFENLVLKSDKPVLVDFWASWCGPCRMMAPVFEEVAASYGDKVNFYKLNVDENQDTPKKYGVRGIPTLMLFKDGNVVNTIVGAVPKGQIEELIKKLG